jgi:hypothetical protein
MSSTSASGTTENSTESWWPWYEPSILMILSRPVAARATRIGVHRRLGAGVDEPHLLELEALADRLGQRDRVGRRDREVDRVARGLGQRLRRSWGGRGRRR